VSRRPREGNGSLRALGLPRPVLVRLDAHGLPAAVARERRGAAPQFRAVEQIDEVWCIADEWWRDPAERGLLRAYVRVILEGGGALTLFHDEGGEDGEGGEGDGRWYEQRY